MYDRNIFLAAAALSGVVDYLLGTYIYPESRESQSINTTLNHLNGANSIQDLRQSVVMQCGVCIIMLSYGYLPFSA